VSCNDQMLFERIYRYIWQKTSQNIFLQLLPFIIRGRKLQQLQHKAPGDRNWWSNLCKRLAYPRKKNYTPSVPVCKHHLLLIKGCLDIGTEGVVGLTIFALGGVFLLCSSSKLNLGKFMLWKMIDEPNWPRDDWCILFFINV